MDQNGPLTSKRITSDREVIGATVRPSDAAGRSRYTHTYHADFIARDACAWVHRAVDINSTNAAAVPLKLFREKRRGRKSYYPAKRITRAQKRFLLGENKLANPGPMISKAASMADDIEEVMEHPILDLFDSPNEWQTGVAFRESFHGFSELSGDVFVSPVIGAASGGPMSLWVLPSQFVKIVPDERDFVAGYFYGRGHEVVRFFKPDEVIHHKFRESQTDPWYGKTWLQAVLIESDIYQASRQKERAGWENGTHIDYAITSEAEGGLTEKQVNQIRAEINRSHRGPANAGKYLVMSGQLKLDPLNFTPKEMEYLLGLENVEHTIMALAGVPESLYKLNDANLASSTTGHAQYARMTLVPRLSRECATWNAKLLPRFKDLDGYFLAYDNPVPEDRAAQMTEHTGYVNHGVMTQNEARAALGLEPEDGGDILRINGVPLGLVGQINNPLELGGFRLSGSDDDVADDDSSDDEIAIARDPAATAGAANSDNGKLFADSAKIVAQVTAGEIPAESAIQMLVTFLGMDEGAARAIVEPAAKAREENEAQAEEIAEQQEAPEGDETPNDASPPQDGSDEGKAAPATPLALSHRAVCLSGETCECFKGPIIGDDSPLRDEPTETDLAKRIAAFFKTQRSTILSRMKDLPDSPAVEALIVSWGATSKEWNEALKNAFGDSPERAIKEGGKHGADQVGKLSGQTGIAFDIDNPEAQEFLQRHKIEFGKTVAAVNDETEARIRAQLEEGLREGESIGKLKKRVRYAFDGPDKDNPITDQRAEMIARTETARAYTEGQQAAWKASGEVAGKKWITSPNACEFCRALSGKTVPLEKNFLDLGGTLKGVEGGSMAIDYRNINGPGLHPHCRCDFVPVLGDV